MVAGLEEMLRTSNDESDWRGAAGNPTVKTDLVWAIIGDKIAATYRWLLGCASQPDCVLDQGASVPRVRSLPIAVIIPTKNEEKNLCDCVKSVAWAEKVFVVDSRSQDRTRAIAEELGAEVVDFDYNGGWPKKKNWAIRHLPILTPWFLILDADERVDHTLAQEMARAIEVDDVDGYYLRWRFVFLGRWMRHSWSHGWMLRLVRTGKGEYEDLGMRGEGGWDNEVHENINVEGKTARLRGWLTHDSHEGLSYWVRKQNEFSDWNAVRRLRQLEQRIPPVRNLLSSDPLARRKFRKALFLRMPFKPLLTFLYLYIFKMGFLDGRAGLYFCALRAAHELNINAKMFEMRARAKN